MMLSYILEKPSRLGLGANVSSCRSNDDGREPDELDMSFLQVGAALTAFHGDVVVQKVSSIPHLVEELLLNTDKAARDRIFNLSVIRRALLRISSFGSGRWFMNMLANASGDVNDHFERSEGAVYYLEQVSAVRPDDLRSEDSNHETKRRGSFHKISAEELEVFQEKRDTLFQAIGNLDGFLPSLVLLDEKLVDRAAVSSVVQVLLRKHISSPFATAVAFFDVLYSILLIASFRAFAAEPMFHLMPNVQTFSPRRDLYSSMLFSTCIVYFSFRIHSQELGKWQMSRRMFWSELLSFWNLAQSAPVVMAWIVALVVSWSLRVHFVHTVKSVNEVGVPDSLRIAVAVTTGALWLKLLAHLKMINKQLATFVLCVTEIMRDIKWFLLVKLIAMAAFAQMYKTLMFTPEAGMEQGDMQGTVQHTDGDYQRAFSDTAQNARFHGYERNESGSTVLNSSFSPYYYFTAYTVMLGSFETADLETLFSVLLFTLYTFLVTIVLLNVLIAIVSDSYARSMELSKSLFGRARVMFGADLDVQRKYWELRDGDEWKYHTLTTVFVTKASFYALMVYITISRSEIKHVEGTLDISVGTVGMMGTILWVESLLVPLCAFICSSFVGGMLRGTASHNGSHVFRHMFSILKSSARVRALDDLVDGVAVTIQGVMVRFLDTSECDTPAHLRDSEEFSGDQRRRGQTSELVESELKEVVRKTERNLKATLNDSNGMLRDEMVNKENRLVVAMKASEERMADRISMLIKESEQRMLEAMKLSQSRNSSYHLPTPEIRPPGMRRDDVHPAQEITLHLARDESKFSSVEVECMLLPES